MQDTWYVTHRLRTAALAFPFLLWIPLLPLPVRTGIEALRHQKWRLKTVPRNWRYWLKLGLLPPIHSLHIQRKTCPIPLGMSIPVTGILGEECTEEGFFGERRDEGKWVQGTQQRSLWMIHSVCSHLGRGNISWTSKVRPSCLFLGLSDYRDNDGF